MFRRGSNKTASARSSLASDALASIANGSPNLQSSLQGSGPPPPPKASSTTAQATPSPQMSQRRTSRSQFDAELSQMLNKLDFYTNVLLSLRSEVELHLQSTKKMVTGMQSLASCIGVGLLDDDESGIEAVHDFSVGVNTIEENRVKELQSDLESTVLAPIQQTLNLNYSLDLRVQERENLADMLEKVRKDGGDASELEAEFLSFNQVLKLELGEHIEARKMVLKRGFESLRNGLGCFFSGASRCVSHFDDAFGDLPVEGKALSVEAIGAVEEILIEEVREATILPARKGDIRSASSLRSYSSVFYSPLLLTYRSFLVADVARHCRCGQRRGKHERAG